ncbi:MAG: hypothetical protein K2K57_07245 [Oscillospiraceae bacterium]|nr:hypothetical protein [Oscillospiraceae bacterium]
MPGKIYDLSDLDNLELPPLPSQAAKKTAAAPTAQETTQAPAAAEKTAAPVDPLAVCETASADNFELPPLPVKKLAKVEAPNDVTNAADNAISSDSVNAAVPTETDSTAGGDLDLPPLPKKAAEQPSPDNPTAYSTVEQTSEAGGANDFDLPPLPVRKPDNSAANTEASANEAVAATETPVAYVSETANQTDDFELPPLPAKPEAENSETENSTDNADSVNNISYEPPAEEAASDGFDLPPLPERKPENEEAAAADGFDETDGAYREEHAIYDTVPENQAEPEPSPREEKPAPRVSLEDNPDIDLNDVTPEDIGISDPSKVLAPMHTAKEAKARNVREKMKMDELAMNMDAPILDDLSDEYAAPEKRADDLLERDYLESDEKQVLKQRLHEDLGRRPENFNARASRNMYNKLMEEKKLKIAKKGMMLSFIPIVMQLIAAGLCYFKMNWGNYQWFAYVAIFGVASAVLLLIKSKHTKMFSIIISAMTVLMYVGPGLVMYALDEKMQAADDYIVHIVCAAAAALLNVGAILLLTKNEPINIYYTTKFRRK